MSSQGTENSTPSRKSSLEIHTSAVPSKERTRQNIMRSSEEDLSTPLVAAQGATTNSSEPLPGKTQNSVTGSADYRVANINEANQQFCKNFISTARYNIFDFVPKTLFLQFRRLANVYFLIMSILMWVGTVYPEVFNSPLTPGSTLGPLIVIVFLTCIKEGLEDLKRHRSDKKTNNRLQDVIVGGEIKSDTQWRDIRVGQLVIVRDKDQIPADLVLIASSSGDKAVIEAVADFASHVTNDVGSPADSVPVVDGGCFIETSNIDGETNLKIREIPSGVQEFLHSGNPELEGIRREAGSRRRKSSSFEASQGLDAAHRVSGVKGTLEFEEPNRSIHTFVGTIRLQNKSGRSVSAPLSARNLLLRGASLRNTDWIIGIVVYTGFESKIMKNSRSARTKLSRMETLVNRCIKLILVTQMALATVSMALGLFVNEVLEVSLPWYLFPEGPANATKYGGTGNDTTETILPQGLSLWITFFILFNNVVPISLYVTVEMVNFMQAFYIDNDLEMYDPETDTPALARTSSLNADLGQIEWIFSDKTGTLTCNQMKLRRCAIGNEIYGKASDEGLFRSRELVNLLHQPKNVLERDFFTALSVCHTVVVESLDSTGSNNENESVSASEKRPHGEPPKGPVYRAESPDEGALVEGAAAMGFKLVDRSGSEIIIHDSQGRPCPYRILAINAFNSTRKRMSMLVQCPGSKKLRLICKGADNMILERSRISREEHDSLGEKLSKFAGQGLRTLVIAQRTISRTEGEKWLNQFKQASESVDNRRSLLAQAAEAIEKDLQILGITAIEDRLQEGVPDTIYDLLRAGIKVWVLTGDKVETAINIGFSSKLLKRATTLIRITDPGTTAEEVEKQLRGLCETFKALTSETNNSMVLRMMNRLNYTLFRMGKGVVKGLEDVGRGMRGMVRSMAGKSVDNNSQQHSNDRDLDPYSQQRGSNMSMSTSGGSQDGKGELALIVTGEALEFILADAKLSHLLMDIGRVCDAVIACRVSPSQKANIVAMVHALAKPYDAEPPMTLAIGDGANDVGMIMEAQIGVGISGHEGLQAVNNSDFAIAQFRFLKRLLLVHGRWNYRRSAKVFLYSFYKNVVLVLTLFMYLPPSKISGQSLYDSLVYAGYNFFLGWPIVGVGIFDQDISVPTVLKYPELYISGRLNLDLRRRRMLAWVIMAVIHSAFIYFIPMLAFNRLYHSDSNQLEWVEVSTESSGKNGGIYVLGTSIYVCLICAMHWKVMWHTYSWTWVTALFMLGLSFPLFILFFAVYSNWLVYFTQFYGVSLHVFKNATLWLSILLVLTCIAIIEYVKERIRTQFFPTAIDIAMELDRGFSFVKKEVSQTDSSISTETDHNTSSEAPRKNKLLDSSAPSDTPQILSNLRQKEDLLVDNPTASLSSRKETGDMKNMKRKSERKRQSHIEDAMNIEDSQKTYLGLSTGRLYPESSYAFDHPSRELGRATFDSGDWASVQRRLRAFSRDRSGSSYETSGTGNDLRELGSNLGPMSSSNIRRIRSLDSKQVSLTGGMSKNA